MEGNEAASRLPREATIKYFSSTSAQGVLKTWKINHTQFSLNGFYCCHTAYISNGGG